MRIDTRDRLIAVGIFLLALAIYALLSPGRIDIIDGQWRYEVAHNILSHHSTAILDPGLLRLGLIGTDGQHYSYYGFSGSLAALPLILISHLLAPGNRDLEQFFFSMVSPVFSAATVALLFGIYRSQRATPNVALGWSLVFGFATLFLPLATSVFDQAQNAFLVLSSFYCAYRAKQNKSTTIAILGGIAFIALVNYKEAYLVLWPGLLWIAGLDRPREAILQIGENRNVQIYIASGIIGLVAWGLYNYFRFGQLMVPHIPGTHPPVLGNTIIGFAGLTISPGKGLLWYSPAVILIACGWRSFWKTQPKLAKGIVIAIASWTLLIASLTFFGGDWCWGPRYWVPILPLFFIAAPFTNFSGRGKRTFAALVITTSLGIQCMAVAVDHQRFFFARGLTPFFWYIDDFYYFEHSALITRVNEIRELRLSEVRLSQTSFRPGPHPESLTYAIFGPTSMMDLINGKHWMEAYPVFSLPRPWPAWSAAIEDTTIAVARLWAVAITLIVGMLGIALLAVAFMRTRRTEISTPTSQSPNFHTRPAASTYPGEVEISRISRAARDAAAIKER